MKTKIAFFIIIVLTTSAMTFSQVVGNKSFWNYNIEENIFVQNTCNNSLKVKLHNSYIDSIKCRTDSVFKTDKLIYFHLKSFDQNNKLVFAASIHIHANKNPYVKYSGLEILTSHLYQDSLSVDSFELYDKNGIPIKQKYSLCDFYGLKINNWEYYGTDEFGTKTIITNDQIKRMPIGQ